MTKIKVIDLNDFYNFVVDDFFRWNHLHFQIFVWSCYVLKFKFYIVQIKSDEEMAKIKVVDLKNLWIFVVNNFSIWIHLMLQNTVWNLISNCWWTLFLIPD